MVDHNRLGVSILKTEGARARWMCWGLVPMVCYGGLRVEVVDASQGGDLVRMGKQLLSLGQEL